MNWEQRLTNLRTKGFEQVLQACIAARTPECRGWQVRISIWILLFFLVFVARIGEAAHVHGLLCLKVLSVLTSMIIKSPLERFLERTAALVRP